MQTQLHHAGFIKTSRLPMASLYSAPDNFHHKPIWSWIKELRMRIYAQYVTSQNNTSVEMADLFNDAILIFIAIGELQLARELCYSQIQVFLNWQRKMHHPNLTWYIFLPWIHLIRIDRLERNFQPALSKINALHEVAWCHFEDIQTYSSIEYIKIGLMLKRYNDLNHYIEYQENNSPIHKNILFEAKYLALMNMGCYQEAKDFLLEIHSLITPKMHYIFKLREIEMTTSPSETILNELYLFGLNLLDFTYGNDVSFVLRVAQTLQDFRLREEALQLYYACLAAARKLNDDWLTAQSLTGLHSLSIDKKKAAVENAMIKHYYQTQYAVAKIHMLQCLPDLKYVETCNCRLEAASLFEELLTLSHFY